MKLMVILSKIFKRLKINRILHDNIHVRKIITLFISRTDDKTVNEAIHCISHNSPRPTGVSYTNNKSSDINYDLKIIVPAYNVENYIDECLLSILSQKTDYTFSIIVINDGSNDGTTEILKKYENNSSITIINQPNKGFSGARNRGLEEINSRYLMFIDSDDKLPSNSIQALLSSAFKSNADIVEGSYVSFHKNTILNKNLHTNQNGANALETLRGFPWGKVIRSSLFENLKYPEGYWYEDTIFAYLVFPRCENVSTISDVVYFYRRNPNGISITSKSNKKCIDSYWILEQMLKEMGKLNIHKTQDIYEHTLRQIHTNFIRTQLMSDEIKKSIFTLSANIINSEFKDFKTTNKEYIILENSLKNDDYNKYFLFCLLC